MSRQDPGAATGRQVYTTLPRCTCGHPVGVHGINTKGLRALCSARGPQAKACGCRLYVAGAVSS